MARKTTMKASTVATPLKVFVDTGGWYAVSSANDRQHEAAVSYYSALAASGAILLTSDYVLDETLTRLRYDFGHSVAMTFWQNIVRAKQAHLLTILHVDPVVW